MRSFLLFLAQGFWIIIFVVSTKAETAPLENRTQLGLFLEGESSLLRAKETHHEYYQMVGLRWSFLNSMATSVGIKYSGNETLAQVNNAFVLSEWSIMDEDLQTTVFVPLIKEEVLEIEARWLKSWYWNRWSFIFEPAIVYTNEYPEWRKRFIATTYLMDDCPFFFKTAF